jgi:hypothetical protein
MSPVAVGVGGEAGDDAAGRQWCVGHRREQSNEKDKCGHWSGTGDCTCSHRVRLAYDGPNPSIVV